MNASLKRFYEHVAAQKCIRCNRYGVEVAHIQAFPSRKHSGMMPRRLGVSAMAAIPLCPDCHRHAPDSIHNIGEAEFIARLDKTPCYVFQYMARLIAEAAYDPR